MVKKIITSALPYVNNQPHLGNIIGCVLSGDVYSRFCKKNKEDVVYLCGTDEYGTAIEIEALKKNKKPIEICEENRIIHKKIYDWFQIDFDYFGRTTTESHTFKVQEIFKKIYSNGFFTENQIEQHFCENCENFLADRYVEGICKNCGFKDARGDQCDKCGHTYKSTDLIDPRCAICNSIPIIKGTNHLFFNLDLFKNQLIELYNSKNQFWSENGSSITKSWLDKELLPRCMTRDLKNKWGVPVPLKGYESKVFYVWFDAVIGYFTFLEECLKEKECNNNNDINNTISSWFKDGQLIQFMGKDNVFFHTIIFPSLIFATNQDLPLIEKLSATEFLLFENKKFSKSRGHGIFGMDLVNNELGSSDIWRYYLIKIRPKKNDSNFSFKHFVDTIKSDLNNNIGNFCNRVLKFIKSKCNRRIHIEISEDEDSIKLKEEVNSLYLQHKAFLSGIKLRDSLNVILEISRLGNEYVQKIISDKKDKGNGFSVAFSVIALLGQLLEPFVPEASSKLLKMCNLESKFYPEEFDLIKEHEINEEIVPLFNPIDDEIIEKFSKFMEN
ncbi:methionyl-tRNA synthetase, cytoplasmic [Nosema bombycis CQ1]|uniref:methionine--tRNA ligase n=1 Tax=Nosema bombycis (strain CQ1 / CVCC 102059) TaxID=578461 RepID=R0KVB2_NOSB1|nr:methionyl-tRNA synthetase, cytoplasmic [Nosema bombycis CQ1]|eukprot:EOB14811.1 methionyl-tRNA synthetase, cytoplasmic [Nosema bombycis CQ1]